MKITGRGLSVVIAVLLVINALSPVLKDVNVKVIGEIVNRTINTENTNAETFVIIDRNTFEYLDITSFSRMNIVHEYDAEVLFKIDLTTLDSLKKQGVRVRELPKRTTLYVNDYNFDFWNGEPSIPEELKANPDTFVSNRMFIVHFLGPIANEWIDKLEATGAVIINYIPNFAYQVMMTPKQKAEVVLLPFVDWVGDYHPAYKISPDPDSENISISLVRSSTELETISAISQLVEVQSTILTPDGYRIIAESPAQRTIETIAKMEDVRYIGPYSVPQLMDEVGMQITGGFWDPANPSTPYRDTGDYGAYVNHLGYTGKGVTVAIADSGIGDGTNGNAGHPDFTGRVISGICYDGGGWSGGVLSDRNGWSDGYGHGTHVTGLVGANGYAGTGIIYAGHGPYYAGMGLAYNATFYSQKIFDDSARWIGPDNFSEIPRDGYQGGAVITQNSWGESPGDGAYCVIDEAYDRAARDADPALDGNQELTQVFAAGNDGPLQNTIGSPASGKNVICIGSVPNYMPDSDSYGDEYGGGTGPDSISSFSSRGWTDDNRIKPDVVAPGEAVLSTRSPVGGTGHGLYTEDSRYMWASGTSMATPTATGAVAVLYEWFLTTYGVEPSPAVLKALLINSAVDIGTPDIPNKNEGWGLVNISTVIDSPATWQIHDQEHELTTGVIDEFKVTYDVPTEPLKITLVYTDRYALDGDSVTLKNQVNLEVLSPSGDVYHGNAFSNGWTTANTNPNVGFDNDQDGYDDRNNVEAVYIPSGELQSGVYTIRVIGSNIVADADNDGVNDQDYALVMFNTIESVPWPYDWFSIGMDSIGDGTLGDTTLNITEVKTAYDSDYLFIRLVLQGLSPKLTDNSWWVYLDLTADGENDWLVEDRPDISGGVFSYEWSTINSNWTPKMISTVSDMDSDSAVRNITVSGSGCIDFALKLDNYPGFNLNAFKITAASDTLEDLNLSDDTNRNPTDTSDPSCSDVAEFDDSVGPISFVNVPPTITTADNITAHEDDFYFVNYDASDPQGGLLKWSIKTNASFLSITKLTGFLKGIPTNADVGEFWVNVTIIDPGGLLDFHNFTLSVINVAPSIITEDLKYAVSEVFYNVDYNSSDDGQGSVSWGLVTNATWLSINSSNGVLNGTPTNSDVGYYWVNVSVSDGCGDSDFHNFTLTVLLPHLPIIINNNTEFADQAVAESWPGSGTPLDPYIIEGYSINATKAKDAISISNTNVSFEVKGNYLYNASTGVFLYNVTNGLIQDNTLLNNDDGILIWHSSNGKNTILRNNISHDSWYGIEIFYSSFNIISHNTISDIEGDGIYLENSDWNIIDNNTISGIFWYEGISLDISNNNSFNNNTILDTGDYGVLLDESKNNIFSGNKISLTTEISMFLDHSQNNIIYDNNIFGGIYIYEALSESIINNTITQGIYLQYMNDELWDTHTIISNTVGEKPLYFWKNRNGGTISSDAGQVILLNCTNIIIENLKIDSTFVGIKLAMSSHITIANNTISNTLNFFEVGEGILSYDSDDITIINNTITRCFSESISIGGINNSIISNIISDTILGDGIFFTGSNGIISNNNIHSNKEYYGLYLSYGSDNTITNNNITNNKNGICIKDSNFNLIDNNFILNNHENYGIRLLRASWNTLCKNTIMSNPVGVFLQDSSSNNNNIYHNNFIDNVANGYDSGVNSWNLPYPLGGNYWSDYTGVDLFKGPNQDQPGSDGIGDTNHSIDPDSVDYYPLIEPYTYKPLENYSILKQGWNLISIPLLQDDQDLTKVLEMIDGYYDAVQWLNITAKDDPWKHYKVGKPFGNDLFEINETMGFWIHITQPGDTIFQYNGTEPTINQTILLHPGWNLVGYPSLTNYNRTEGLNNLTFDTDVDSIWTYDAATQKWHELGPSDYFEIGRGYWVHAKTKCVWEIPL